MPEIGFVVAVTAVFVFDLQHDDRAARRVQVLFHERQNRVQISVVRGEESGVHAAELDAGPGGEPGRQPAVLPLGADVRAGTDDRIESGPVDFVEKRFEVQHAGEVELPRFRFVQIVTDIGFDRVEAHHLRFGDAVAPLLGTDAEIVDGSRDDLRRLSGDPDRAA